VPVGEHKKYTSVTEWEYENLTLYDILWRADEHCLYSPSDIKEYLVKGLDYLEENYGDLSKYNPENNWGHIDGVIKVVKALIRDSNIYPEATLHHCR
jgi:hypothetical protein